MKKLIIPLALLSAIAFTGCTTQLEVSNKMTRSIFLEPTTKKTIAIQVTDTSDQGLQDEVKAKIIQALEKKGYKIIKNPKEAEFFLQVNLLYMNNTHENNHPGQVAVGTGIGGAIVGSAGGDSGNGLAGAIIGATVGYAAAKLDEDDIHRMIVDIKITEKTDNGNKEFITRIFSQVTRHSIKMKEALPILEEKVVKSIVGIFN